MIPLNFIIPLVFCQVYKNIYFFGKFSCWNFYFFNILSFNRMCLVMQYAYLPENMMLLENYASKRTLFPNLLKLSHSIKTNGRRILNKYFGIPSQDFPKHLISRQLTAILFPRATVLLHAVTQLCLLIVACCRIPDDVSVWGYVTNSFHPFHWFRYKMTSSAPADVDAGPTSHQPGN